MEYIEYILNFIIFILDFITKIGWELVCLIIFFSLKKPIKELIKRLTKASYEAGKWSFEFDKVMRDLGISVKEINEINYNFLQKSKNLGLFIIDEWHKMNNIAREKLKSLKIQEKDDKFINKYERPLEYLEHRGCFSPQINNAITVLRTFRDDVIHNGYNNITIEDLEKYREIVNKVIENINPIQELPFTHLRGFTAVMSELIILVDSKKHDSITIEEVREHIKNENIIKFIADLSNSSFLHSIIENNLYNNFEKYYNAFLKSLYENYGGDERRKWGIENSGLCLLLAWTNQIIQSGSGWYPETNIAELNS